MYKLLVFYLNQFDHKIFNFRMVNKQQTSSSTSSSTSQSSDDTSPVLSSLSSISPVRLMSIRTFSVIFISQCKMETFVDTNNDCSLHKIDNASTSLYNLNRKTKIDRYWPIDPPNRRNRKIYHYRTRNNHRQKIYHQQLFRR